MDSYIIGILIFCLVAAAISSLYIALFGSHRALQDRFDEMALKMRVSHAPPGFEQAEPEGLARSVVRWTAQRMPKPKDTASIGKLSQTLVRAGFYRAGALRLYLAVRVLSIIGGVFAGMAATLVRHNSGPKAMLFMVAGGFVGAIAPGYYLGKRAQKRQGAIARELSDVLDLLVVCVEAGLGLFEAIKIVGEETERQGQVIGTELTMVSGEVSAGSSLGQALRSLGERTAVEDLKPLAATLIQSEQLGAQIGPALRSSSDALRTKRRLRAEEAAQKSTIKILFPLVLFVLPAMLIVIIAPALIEAIQTLSSQY